VDYTTGRSHFGVAVPAMLLGGALFEAGAALLKNRAAAAGGGL
jgi:hypothetical protein